MSSPENTLNNQLYLKLTFLFHILYKVKLLSYDDKSMAFDDAFSCAEKDELFLYKMMRSKEET